MGKKAQNLLKNRVLRVVAIASLSMGLFFFTILQLLMFVASRDDVDGGTGVIVILGAGLRGDKLSDTLKERLDKGYKYSLENPEAIVVVSGEKGNDEHVSEAYAMKQYLMQKGISEKKILMEDQSTSTFENLTRRWFSEG